ncbi:MAG: aminodeoxychorismate/anthranilate synthase component II [Planctomycetes bacterium]|nr:aminodeoxychorismate/anthranilate synthase component II [Planctomycetota bacterium]
MILLIDNYDSFTYNLYHMVAGNGFEVEVVRNDVLSVEQLLELNPRAVILSPGPGRPRGAGVCLDLLEKIDDRIPLLGVCLGHQAIVEACGGDLFTDAQPKHGKSSIAQFDDAAKLFHSVKNPLEVGRYHSLTANEPTLPSELRKVAWLDDGTIMAVEHVAKPWFGVQFHPESILSPQGQTLIDNFLHVTKQNAKN